MGLQSQRQRHTIGDRMKVHLRVRTLGGQSLRILSPRPGTDVCLATNRYHETWHLLSDLRGARLLAHLAWSLSYQRRPGTIVLIDHPFLRDNPFDAGPSDPIVLVHRDLTPLGRRALHALARERRRLGPPDQTVRLHTRGLGQGCQRYPRDGRETFERCAGFLVLRASAAELRWLAGVLAELRLYQGSSYVYFAEQRGRGWRVDGEVQIFDDFRARLPEARLARQALGLPQGTLTEDDNVRIWVEAACRRERRERRGFGR